MRVFRASISHSNRKAKDWTVQDLGSKNGTFVNNIPLKARLILKPGDRITAGHVVCVFAPNSDSPNANVVVFDGSDNGSPTTSTVVTSLEGAMSNQTLAIERGGSQGVGADAGTDPRGSGAFDQSAARRAVPRDSPTWRFRP